MPTMPTTNMPAIYKLPFEMLGEILSHLRAADLVRTALVSRRLHDVSMPLLYRAPVLRFPGRTTHRPSLKLFLWTILTPGRESLAAHVRSLSASWYRADPSTRCPSEDVLLDPIASRFGLRRGYDSQGTRLVLLLHLLPHLQVLTITPPVRYSTFTKIMEARYTQRMHPTTSRTLPLVLQSLREFYSPPANGDHGVSHKTLLMLLLLPCIRVIDVSIMDENNDAIALCPMKPLTASSTVTKLRLADRSLSPTYLPLVLAMPTTLTHFSYSTVRFRARFNLDAFWAALRPLRVSVVNLQLDLKLAAVHRPTVGPLGNGDIWPLREWSVLRKLSCSLVAVMGQYSPGTGPGLVDVLPLGIRELEVTRDRNWVTEAVVEQIVLLLRGKRVVVPGLERVAVRDVNPQALEELSGVSDVSGVTILSSLPRW